MVTCRPRVLPGSAGVGMAAPAVVATAPVDTFHEGSAGSKLFAKIRLGLDTVTEVFTALLQLPAVSWTRRLNRCAPMAIPASGTVADAVPLVALTDTLVALPTPGSVVPSQNSAAPR